MQTTRGETCSRDACADRLQLRYLLLISALAGGLCSCEQKDAKEKPLPLRHYIDPEGHFVIDPPKGWSVREYPVDRGIEVAFAAKDPRAEIRVLVNASDFTTPQELQAWCRANQESIGLVDSMGVVELAGNPAVRMSGTNKSGKVVVFHLLVGSSLHSILYQAPDEVFERYLEDVQQSIQSYGPVLKGNSEVLIAEQANAKRLRIEEFLPRKDTDEDVDEPVDEPADAVAESEAERLVVREVPLSVSLLVPIDWLRPGGVSEQYELQLAPIVNRRPTVRVVGRPVDVDSLRHREIHAYIEVNDEHLIPTESFFDLAVFVRLPEDLDLRLAGEPSRIQIRFRRKPTGEDVQSRKPED